MISIASLIFKSIEYLEFVRNSILEHTPKIREGEAEFYFVCNNATKEVKDYLKRKEIKHYVFETEKQPPYPENIIYIYKAWNYAVKKAKGEIVVLVNSDMAFSRNWLENLVKYLDEKKIITSRLVESGRIPSIFPHTVVKNFGRSPKEFKKEDFEIFAENIKEDKILPGGTFMPLSIYKDVFLESGGFPEKRVETSGDFYLFYKILDPKGVKHYTAMDSVVYHIQEGEVSE